MLFLFLVALWNSNFTQAGTFKDECPANFVRIKGNPAYIARDFCIMKYEARALHTSGTVDLDGCNEAGCTTGDWGVATHSPLSTTAGLPWRRISATQAEIECQSLGSQYNLPSNTHWQTIARAIEAIPENWTTGTIGSGCVFAGNNGNATCGYDGANPEGGTGRNTRARHYLPGGQEIWDFAGNINELMNEDQPTVYGANAAINAITNASHTVTGMMNDQVGRNAKGQFGAAGTYGGCTSNCGFGNATLTPSGQAILRGGNAGDGTGAGIFSVYASNGMGSHNVLDGFRCIFNLTDPCLDTGKTGVSCNKGGAMIGQFQGFDYMVTNGNCNNSATPTCDNNTDTLTLPWNSGTTSYYDIPGITNINAAGTPSSSSEAGEDNTPIIAAISAGAQGGAHAAARFCDNMDYGGYQDWFLPSKSEMTFMFCRTQWQTLGTSTPTDAPECYGLGGFNLQGSSIGRFSWNNYWTSTEADVDDVWSMHSGTMAWSGLGGSLKNSSRYVRCMRRIPSKDPCAGTPARGTVCRGGALYAGTFGTGKYMIMPSGCNDSLYPACGGGTDTLQKTWNGTGGTATDVAGVTNINADATPSTQTGNIVTPILTASSSITADSAIDYCADLRFGGYADWFLPSKSEMAYIYCHSNSGAHNTLYPNEDPNCVSYGGKTSELTGFAVGDYWTSTEASATNANRIWMNDGGQSRPAKTNSHYVRCIRRFQ